MCSPAGNLFQGFNNDRMWNMPPTCLQTFQTFSHTWLDLEQYIFRQKSHLPMPELLHLQISVSSIVCLVRAAWHLSSASVPWFSTIFWAAAADCTELKILEDLTICYFLERNRTGEKEAFTHISSICLARALASVTHKSAQQMEKILFISTALL